MLLPARKRYLSPFSPLFDGLGVELGLGLGFELGYGFDGVGVQRQEVQRAVAVEHQEALAHPEQVAALHLPAAPGDLAAVDVETVDVDEEEVDDTRTLSAFSVLPWKSPYREYTTIK